MTGDFIWACGGSLCLILWDEFWEFVDEVYITLDVEMTFLPNGEFSYCYRE